MIVEGDAKICIHAFNDLFAAIPWKIQTLISNARDLFLSVGSIEMLIWWLIALAKFVSSLPRSLSCIS